MTETKTVRGQILETAKSLTESQRNQVYGDPKDGMTCFARLVAAYLSGKYTAADGPITHVDGSVIACLLKISRIAANPKHMDSYVDLAAYAAIAGECAGVKEG